METLRRSFYERDTSTVARQMLGKVLVVSGDLGEMRGRIVETEAYYGRDDPASRAFSGRPKHVVDLMSSEPGRIIIYMVHNSWLLNISAHEKGKMGAVLIRAVEPLLGEVMMQRNRPVKKLQELSNGPGKLSKAFGVDKRLNGLSAAEPRCLLRITGSKGDGPEIESSNRIGVTRDMRRKLRYYVKGSIFVSK
jgi:DNA-3-methyladenine glycosylase